MMLAEKSPSLAAVVMLVGGALVAVTTPAVWHPPGGDLSWLNGERTLAWEKAIDEDLSILDASISFWANVQYFLFGEGRPGVLVGDDGWLYTTEEFNQPMGAEQATHAKLDLIVDVHRKLAEADIALVVALLPDKSRVYPDHLGRYARPASVEVRYEDFRTKLFESGIVAPDVFGAMRSHQASGGARLFLKTDTHWSPEGAEVVAVAIADIVNSLALPPSNSEIVTIADPEATAHSGDLLKFLPLGPLAAYGPAPDEIASRTTLNRDQSAGLFGEVDIDIALVGTSYSANETWNFAGALSERLQREVLNAAEEGKGPVLPMIDYLASREFEESPPRVVIWEIPERFLPVRYDFDTEVLP